MKPGYSAGALLLCTTSFVSMPTSAQTTVDESAVQTTAPSPSVSPRSDPTRFASPRSRRMRAAPRGPGSGERQRRAPEAVAAEPDTDRTDEEITVTGSRIARSGVDSASPVTMVSSEELAKSSPSTLAAALNNLPALVASGGPNATAGRTSSGRNALNLRGLGNSRTLVMVDGRRFPGSTPGGSVDTNLIPQALVSRVDVVTGGASAAYGSDAVAGVVNFILDKRFEGAKMTLGTGISERGDASERRASATFGRAFADGRLHVVVSGEYYDNDGVRGDARDFTRQGAGLIPNPAVTAANPASPTNPALIVAPAARIRSTFGGVIVSAVGGNAAAQNGLIGTQFLAGGVPAPYDYGQFASASLQSGGSGVNPSVLQPINRELSRATGYANVGFDVTDDLKIFVDGGYGWSESSNPTNLQHAGQNVLTITRDNAFLPASIRARMVAGNITSFRMNRHDGEYETIVVATNRNWRVQTGVEWKFGNFRFDASYQRGHNRETAPNFNNYIRPNYAAGIDTVLRNGVAVCRSTIANPTNGCVPIDPFGPGSYSPEAIAWFTGTSDKTTTVDQELAQANVSGPLFGGIGAGPWEGAIGIEYRKDSTEVTSNALSAAGQYFAANQIPFGGGQTVRETYGEINLPLLKESRFARYLEANAAVRFTRYSLTGGVTTWKLGLNHQVVDELRLRATLSRDIAAPTHSQMFLKGGQTVLAFNDPFNGGVRVLNVPVFIQGNPDLIPEVARTTVLGAVYKPQWLPGFAVSLDRIDLKLSNAITSLGGQALINLCFEGNAQACASTIRDSNNNLIQLNNSSFNLDSLKFTSYDFESSYRRRAAGGNITARAYVSYLQRLLSEDRNAVATDDAGEIATPHWRGLFSIGYDRGIFQSFLQARYIGGSKLNNQLSASDAEFNRVGDVVYLDGQIGARVTRNMELSLNIQNLLDRRPPFSPEAESNSPVNQNVYDQIGRAFRLSARFNF